MWMLIITLALLAVPAPIHSQQVPSRCVQLFDQGFRKCFRDMGGFELDIVFALVTNETSGRLPPNLAPQKQNLIKSLCGNRQGLTSCVKPLVSNPDQTCQQADIGMMDGTANSMVSGLANLCGATPPPASACLQNFDKGFRTCLANIRINPDHFFMLLADQAMPANVNKDQLKQQSCSDATKQSLMKCSTDIVSALQKSCKPQETIMVGTTLQNMLGAYEGVCTGKEINPDQCMQTFEDGMNECAKKAMKMDIKTILMVLNNQTLPPGADAASLKKQICSTWKNMQGCGKSALSTTGCSRIQLLQAEATFANMMITTATFCGDTSLPGACLLTLQSQFGECFGKVGLSPDIYLSNKTDHKGALIGANTAEAEVYCGKKHDLFTCMNEVMHSCPGAEQTLALTGFDLHGMERAVGILCHNIPNYLAGLKCFEAPTQAAKGCMEDMTMAITDLSTKQITQKLNMDVFFQDFCTARVKHVKCDSNAWPACNKPAVSLKNRFECQLIPSRCYDSHKDNIDAICPNTEKSMPGGGETKMHVHEQTPCVRQIHASMDACFQEYGVDADMFLVNITHDRRNFLGDAKGARNLCTSRAKVFQCMRRTLDSCTGAVDVLAFWGHQQSSLEKAVNVICNELPLYNKGIQCLVNGNSQVQQCISNTESKMMNLADKQVSKNLSPDSYFRDFCSIRIEHLRCDLNGWKQTCGADVVGLKTEFECKLIQDHCKNLQVGNFKTICNDQSYATMTRQSGQSGGGGGNGAGSTSASGIIMFGSTLLAFLLALL